MRFNGGKRFGQTQYHSPATSWTLKCSCIRSHGQAARHAPLCPSTGWPTPRSRRVLSLMVGMRSVLCSFFRRASVRVSRCAPATAHWLIACCRRETGGGYQDVWVRCMCAPKQQQVQDPLDEIPWCGTGDKPCLQQQTGSWQLSAAPGGLPPFKEASQRLCTPLSLTVTNHQHAPQSLMAAALTSGQHDLHAIDVLQLGAPLLLCGGQLELVLQLQPAGRAGQDMRDDHWK